MGPSNSSPTFPPLVTPLTTGDLTLEMSDSMGMRVVPREEGVVAEDTEAGTASAHHPGHFTGEWHWTAMAGGGALLSGGPLRIWAMYRRCPHVRARKRLSRMNLKGRNTS